MEWNDAEKLLSGPIELDFKPFQIRTEVKSSTILEEYNEVRKNQINS